MSLPPLNNEQDLLNYLLTKEQDLKTDAAKKASSIYDILIEAIMQNIHDAMEVQHDPEERKKALEAISKQLSQLMDSISKDGLEYNKLKSFSDALQADPSKFEEILTELQAYLATLGTQKN